MPEIINISCHGIIEKKVKRDFFETWCILEFIRSRDDMLHDDHEL